MWNKRIVVILFDRKQKIPYNCQQNNNENPLSGNDNMRINVFYVIIDSLLADLKNQSVYYILI